MKIGGGGEFWMVLGPLVAVALLATFVAGGPSDLMIIVERAATDVWSAAVTAFRR
jgi:hypothetical protein